MMVILSARPEGYMAYGTSSETKPTNWVENSTFFEVDTGQWWILTGGVWYKCGKQPH